MTTKVCALWGYCDSVQDRPVFITHKEDPARVETSENPVKIGRFSMYILLQLMLVGFLNQTWESTTASCSPHCASLATHHTQDLGTAAWWFGTLQPSIVPSQNIGPGQHLQGFQGGTKIHSQSTRMISTKLIPSRASVRWNLGVENSIKVAFFVGKLFLQQNTMIVCQTLKIETYMFHICSTSCQTLKKNTVQVLQLIYI